MPTWPEFVARQVQHGAVVVPDSQPVRVARYTDTIAEYRALDEGPALMDRTDRALLEVTGKDRVAWLHNLTTNDVKKLSVGEGSYAFVLNVQGRILFDVNIFVRPDSIWLDLDRHFLDTARKHFTKYIITEDVRLTDRSDEFVRLALTGRGAVDLLSALGAPNAPAMAQLSQSTIEWNPPASPLTKGGLRGVDPSRDREGADNPSRERERPEASPLDKGGPRGVFMLRHDFCGPFAVELFVPADLAVEVWTALVDQHRAVPVGDDAVQIRRIEAGIPWPGREITSEYLPAETHQLDRAVSYQKGCYLGQEVVERMRSRQVVARQLVGLRLEKGTEARRHEGTREGASVLDSDGKPVGTVTSTCHSFALNTPVALAYLKTALALPGTAVTVSGLPATTVELPFRAAK